MEIRGFEPLTPGLQSLCSSQLSYIPAVFQTEGGEGDSLQTCASYTDASLSS